MMLTVRTRARSTLFSRVAIRARARYRLIWASPHLSEYSPSEGNRQGEGPLQVVLMSTHQGNYLI